MALGRILREVSVFCLLLDARSADPVTHNIQDSLPVIKATVFVILSHNSQAHVLVLLPSLKNCVY